MQVLSNLNFKNSTITLDQLNDFPINPKLGTIILKNDGLYIYAKNIFTENIEWINLFNSYNIGKKTSYIHTQDIESDQWHITHNLNTQNLFAIIYDTNNVMQIGANIEFINDNEINLNFVDLIKGKAIIFAASLEFGESENKFQLIKAGTVISLNSDQQPTIEVIQEPDGSATINFGIPKGKSAYEIAVENGFEGSEQEWIDALNSKNINVDNKTITKNENEVISVLPSGFIDNKTIIVNSNGKIESKSIPFDTANGCAVSAIGSEYPVVLNSGLSIMAPNFSSGKYTVYNGDKAGVSLGTDYIEITKNGYYLFHAEASFSAVGSSDVDIIFMAYLNDVGFSAQTGVVRPTVANPDFIGITNFSYFNAGDKIHVGYGGQVNQVVMATFGATLLRLPVTNEYQVSNTELSKWSTASGVLYGELYASNWRDILLPSGEGVTDELHDNFIASNTGFTCNSSGVYIVTISHGLATGGATSVDVPLYLIVDGVKVSTTTLPVNPNVSNPDTATLIDVLSLQEGQLVKLTINDNSGGTLTPHTLTCTFTKLPSITDNVDVSKYADGITTVKNENGKLSVLEYRGASESSSGIAGLVPPALSTAKNYPLVGSGEFSPNQTAQSLKLENTQLNEGDISYGSGFFWMDGANKRLQFRFIPGSDNANTGSDKHDYLEIIMVGRDSQGNFQKIEKSIYLNLSNFSAGLHEFTDGVETSYFARQPFGAACHAGAGIGQFMQLSGINIRLEEGGTWVYYHQGFTAAGVPLGNAAGFAAGGSLIANNYDPQTTMGSGWAWKIA